ncbi:hypothetical protein [Ruminococcus flavefaciens]|uniref:hypothetical protein n=1 Tax=Ruminococcus flavefaciens TaxID=1265 RepID=UPI0026EFDD80|nr:hypothetical protein [Ruminococcus flavefaciens]
MAKVIISRKSRMCVLCRYWNGALGSLKIEIENGGEHFSIDNSERHKCFKRGKGIETSTHFNCPSFVPRYED